MGPNRSDHTGALGRTAAISPVAALVLALTAYAPTVLYADADVITTQEGPWIHEDDFDADPTLHKVNGQTVLLRLEQGSKRRGSSTGRPGTNTHRFLVEVETDFEICIPADEPHLTRIKLREANLDHVRRGNGKGRGRTVLQVRPRDGCARTTLTPGSYVFDTQHDHRNVPPGKVGFLSRQDDMQLGATTQYLASTGDCPGCDLTGADLSNQDLSGVNFTGTILTGANLTGTNLTSADLTGARLFAAQLNDAVFSKATLTNADLLDSRLRCTDFSDTDLRTARFGIINDTIAAVTGQTAGTFPDSALFGLDAQTGARFVIEDIFSLPEGVTGYLEGVLVTDQDGLFQVTADDEIFNTISQGGVRGSGIRFINPTGIALEADGSIVVVDLLRLAVIRVDPKTGNRSTVSGLVVGNGPGFTQPVDIAVGGDGTLYVTEPDANVVGQGPIVLAIDPGTGDRTIVSSQNVGSGPIAAPGGIEVESDGSLLVMDALLPGLLRVDPANGDRTLLSGSGAGTGPAFISPGGIVLEGNGAVLVVDSGLRAVLRIDLTTGDREIVSGAGAGSGPAFGAAFDIGLTNTISLTRRIATDFSCRLNLTGATLNLETVDKEFWRYLDLTNARIEGVNTATLSTLSEPLDLSGAILNGVDLSGVVLDGVNLGCGLGASGQVCSSLDRADLSLASLQQAKLADALLRGVTLARANLDGADMSDAKLQALPTQTASIKTDISEAFMRDVLLSGANLTSVTANNVSFFTSNTGLADATGATLTNANFTGAYLAGANFNSVTAQGAIWENAVLVGADFTDADLQGNETIMTPSTFEGSFLQGSSFDGARIDSVTFNNTRWDTMAFDTMAVVPQLNSANLRFAGYWGDPTAPECVAAVYPSPNLSLPSLPVTDGTNTCPNDARGPCSFAETPAGDPPLPFSVCSAEDDGTIDFCTLPAQCELVDACWLTPGFVFGGVCTLNP